MKLAEKIESLPDKPGVYLMKNKEGEIIYIGKAASLKKRVRSYFVESKKADGKTESLISLISDFDFIITDTELESLILESNLIKKHHPRFNIVLRDDKHYPFLKLTINEDFPRLVVTRKIAGDKAQYFGPYFPSTALRNTLRVIKQLFPLRACRIKINGTSERTCLNYQINRCLGPCAGKADLKDYQKVVKDVQLFLEGRENKLIEKLRNEMEVASREANFERAAVLRDQIHAINRVLENQKIISTDLRDYDVIALARNINAISIVLFFIRKGRMIGHEIFNFENAGNMPAEEIISSFIQQFYSKNSSPPGEILVSHNFESLELIQRWLSKKYTRKVSVIYLKRGKKKGLVDMALKNAEIAAEKFQLYKEDKTKAMTAVMRDTLKLPSPPERIEAFDISNIQGTSAVGSMVVWTQGEFDKKEYKRFAIKTVTQADDFAMLSEVIKRRYKRIIEEGKRLPDLIIVDGGRGQLNTSVKTLKEIGIEPVPIISIAKEEEEIFCPGSENPVVLDRDSPVLHLIMKIRDEAHRFAITYHKKLRHKKFIKSALNEIRGIGPAIRLQLLKHFGSIKKIKEATIQELKAAPKINSHLAKRIHDYFHKASPQP